MLRSRRSEEKMRALVREMDESMRMVAREALGLPFHVTISQQMVRSYLYPDGRAIVRLRVPMSMFPKESTDEVLARFGSLDVEAWKLFPPRTFFEASLLFADGQKAVKRKKRKRGGGAPQSFEPPSFDKYKTRYDGMRQIQSFGTLNPYKLSETMRFIVLPKMDEIGAPRPTELLFRAGLSIDESLPFMKKDPPVRRR